MFFNSVYVIMKIGIKSLSLLVILGLMNSVLVAKQLLVPSQYPTIQSAMDATSDGDTVIVAQGTYLENVVFGDKNLTLTSTDPNDPNVVANTVIDANGSGTTVVFPETEGANYVFNLDGFTITGGDNTRGGGAHCHNGNVTISNCIIVGNQAMNGAGVYSDVAVLNCVDSTFKQNAAQSGSGGGIFIAQAELMVIGCTFIQNSATYEGGGVHSEHDKVTLRNCTFKQNSATWGGGMHNSHYGATVNNCSFISNSAVKGGGISMKELREGDRTQRITNCTFIANNADYYGGAVSVRFDGNLIMTNCILWDNIVFLEGPQISFELAGNLSVSYCCVQGEYWDIYAPSATVNWLTGNINVDPCFVNAASGDCHLRSTAGRWNTNTSRWVVDGSNSPCIDAGDPNSDCTSELWPHGKRINMGAYGGTSEASMSLSQAGHIADFNNDGIVNIIDYSQLADILQVEKPLLMEDLDRNGVVDNIDLNLFVQYWLWQE